MGDEERNNYCVAFHFYPAYLSNTTADLPQPPLAFKPRRNAIRPSPIQIPTAFNTHHAMSTGGAINRVRMLSIGRDEFDDINNNDREFEQWLDMNLDLGDDHVY